APVGGVQPEKLPDPKPLPLPAPADPKQPVPKPGDPVGKGGEGLGAAPGAAGDPAADYLRALESAQVGYRIKLDQAIELGGLNAREFQDRREDLYLAALPVTFARYNFATLAFFTEQAVLQSTGRALANGGERWTLNSAGSVSKLFPTGALLTAKL